MRHNSLLSGMIEGAIGGNNSRGRPPLDYIGRMVGDMDCKSYRELKMKAEMCQRWENCLWAVNKIRIIITIITINRGTKIRFYIVVRFTFSFADIVYTNHVGLVK